MRFSIAAAAVLAAGASAGYVNSNATATITEVVTKYTTYCPGPTTITYGTNTYTVTEVSLCSSQRVSLCFETETHRNIRFSSDNIN